MLQNIAIERLFPHPNNPRKDLGELTELAESIKVQGVLQNLTVVPFEDGYRIIIGHRRHSAAKLAGLTELPCAIVVMDERTQIGTMLLENIQRSDLTVLEQAQGFQLMLDLGETVAGISQKTGFSESTVRHRVKLNELDQKKLTEAVDRGGRIEDYIALEKITDPKIRNEVLERIGTNDFQWRLQTALERQEYPARRAKLLEFLKGWTTHTKESPYSSTLEHIHHFRGFQLEGFKKPKDAEKAKYVFTEDDHSITLWKKKDRAAPQKKTAAEINYQEREAQMKELTKQAYVLRFAFVKNFSAGKRYAPSIHAFAMRKLLTWGSTGPEEILKMLDISKPDEKLDYSAMFKRMSDMVMEAYSGRPEVLLLIAVYLSYGDNPGNAYYYGARYESKIHRNQNEKLDAIYDTLIEIGYEMSEEEQRLRDGTHELFDKPEAKE
jgi:ParB family chromosome partitioning protein